MTDQSENITGYRAQMIAAELCKAVDAENFHTAETLYAHESEHGLTRELVTALAVYAVSLARALADARNDVTVDGILGGLSYRAGIALSATAEIDRMTNPTTEENQQ